MHAGDSDGNKQRDPHIDWTDSVTDGQTEERLTAKHTGTQTFPHTHT